MIYYLMVFNRAGKGSFSALFLFFFLKTFFFRQSPAFQMVINRQSNIEQGIEPRNTVFGVFFFFFFSFFCLY
jgi:hypothetical protein